MDPLTELEQLQDRIGNLMQSLSVEPFSAFTTAAAPAWVPPVDIEESEDSYTLEVDLPGVRAEDINLELRGSNELRVSGKYSEHERTGALRSQTRRTGQFEYDVIVPGEVDPEKVDAALQDGVLTVHLGKSTSGQPRRIEVKGPGAAEQLGGTGGQPEAEPAAGEAERAEAKPAAGEAERAEAKPAAGEAERAEAKPAAGEAEPQAGQQAQQGKQAQGSGGGKGKGSK
jgi:HSP20 family protein